MTKAEVKDIIGKVEKPRSVSVYYNIEDANKASEKYVRDYWNSNKDKYAETLAIVVHSKNVIFILDTGVIVGETFWRYDNIIITGIADLFQGELGKGELVFFGKENKMEAVSDTPSFSRFASKVLNEILELHRGLTTKEEKIEYYLNIPSTDAGGNEFLDYVIYKMLLLYTQDPQVIGKYVRMFGVAELYCIKQSLKKVLNVELMKTFPKAYLEIMTLRKKKSYRTISKASYVARSKMLEDCKECLLLMQKCDVVMGYMEYVNLFYDMVIEAAKSKSIIEEQYIHEYNTVINELEDKIKKSLLGIEDKYQQAYLSILACIGDIYFGEVYDNEQSKCKCETMKNLNKAKKWYDIFIALSASEESLKYGRVMLNLAYIYKYGVGDLEANEEEMIKCLKEAANHGSSRACKYLAEYYTNTNSVEKEKWVQLAKSHKQKVKDKRSANEKVKEKVGMDLVEIGDAVGNIVDIGNQISGLISSVNNIVNGVANIAVGHENAKADVQDAQNRKSAGEIKSKEYKQQKMGQDVVNKKEKAKLMKAERKADKKILKEERKRK